ATREPSVILDDRLLLAAQVAPRLLHAREEVRVRMRLERVTRGYLRERGIGGMRAHEAHRYHAARIFSIGRSERRSSVGPRQLRPTPHTTVAAPSVLFKLRAHLRRTA